MIEIEHLEWIAARGLSVEVAADLGLFSKRDRGARAWLVLPYVEHGQVVNHKYRLTGEKRHRMDPEAPLVFWNHDVFLDPEVQTGRQPVVITEGEWDAIAAIQSGFPHVVSVPNGGPKTITEVETPENDAERYRFLWRAVELLRPVTSFILATDGDEVGRTLATDLAARIGPERCRFIRYPDGCKDLNEVLAKHGAPAVLDLLKHAAPYPIKGLTKFSEHPDQPKLAHRSLGLPAHDDAIRLVFGTLTVITGFAGGGKTSLIMFLIANVLLSGTNVVMGSFETMVKPILLEKLVAALCRQYFEWVPAERKAWAEALLEERFSIISQDIHDEEHELTLEEVLELARVAVVRDGAKLLVIDPWNEIEHRAKQGESETEYTGRAIRMWKAFARRHNCAVWIVAHPKKPAEFGKKAEAPGLYDISGSANWANKADYGVVVHRPNKAEPITELSITKVRMGLPGTERGIRLSYRWTHADYVDGGNYG